MPNPFRQVDFGFDPNNRRPRSSFNNVDFYPEEEQDILPSRTTLYDNTDDTPALRAYMQHMAAIPSRENYKPSLTRRLIAAAVGGISRNPEISQNIVQSPLQDALSDWSLKEKGLRGQADIEDAMMNRRNAYLKIAMEAQNNERKFNIDEFDAETRRRNSELTANRDAATDARAKERLSAEIKNWNAQRAAERGRLAVEQGNLAARNRGLQLYGDRTNAMTGKAPSFTQLAAKRKMAEDAAINEMPKEAFDATGKIKPEFGSQLEILIRKKLGELSGLGTDIELPSFGNEDEFNIQIQ